MLKFLRVSVSALALSAFVVAPVATFVSVDYAYAKNGNNGGKGGGNGNGGGNGKGSGNDGGGNGNSGKGNGGSKGSDKSASKGGNGWGSDKSAKTSKSRSAKAGKSGNSSKSKGFGRSLRDDFKSFGGNLKKNGLGGLFKSQKTQQAATKPTRKQTAKVSVTKSKRPPVKKTVFKLDPLHPSNLGKLNGAINASPNAKAAHIANGKFATGKGPVSLAAALAVADYSYRAEFEEYVVELAAAQEKLDLVDALEEASAIVEQAENKAQDLADARAVLADPDAFTPAEVAAAQDTVDAANEAVQVLADAQAIVSDPGSFTPEEVSAAQKTLDIAEEKAQEIVEAATFIDENPAPSQEEIEEANNVIEEGPPSEEDVIKAEDALLAQYKGDLPESDKPDERLSDEEQEVVDAVRDSNPADEVIEEALGEPYDEEDGEDDVTIDASTEGAPPDNAAEENLIASSG